MQKIVLLVGISLCLIASVCAQDFSACRKALELGNVEFKVQWEELCKMQQLHALKEERIRVLKEEASRQLQLSRAVNTIIKNTFCTRKPYPYSSLCDE